ncbi:hypothetical protein [Sphingobacterium siyangense]|uniref:hypothetical protein n=1 Tax=Sphingobacterium siyangense TaxID=459529 RepID=UPI0028963D20|nr:hypothetical protein [Sphingobacterium siyangense]
MQTSEAFNPFCRTHGFFNDNFRKGFYQAIGRIKYWKDETSMERSFQSKEDKTH